SRTTSETTSNTFPVIRKPHPNDSRKQNNVKRIEYIQFLERLQLNFVLPVSPAACMLTV
ncbi:unnamed protein product, partial [Musa banksii]